MQQTDVKTMNEIWRSNRQPNDCNSDAFLLALRDGSLSDEWKQTLVDDLWNAVKDHHKREHCDPENGLATVAEKKPDGVLFRTTTKLWRQQPFGVLYGDIHDRVNGEGSAIVTDVTPRSTTVAEDVLPQEHISMKIVPTPIWIARFIGENGFPTHE